jgi:hypothetical protein
LVDFYAKALTDPETKSSGGFAWEQNLQEVEPFVGVWIDGDHSSTCGPLHAFFTARIKVFSTSPAKREDKGLPRGPENRSHLLYEKRHPDHRLHRIQHRLRYLDIISDLAFLAMDLEYNHFPETARSLIRLYVELTNDIGALPLLNFYRCYRAMVRCKVSCLRLRESAGIRPDLLRGAAGRYLAMAHDYAAAFSRPILWVVCGLPASGKSTIAGAGGSL